MHEKWKSISRAQLCDPCDSMDYKVHGILQARILEWVAVPFSKGSSKPRDQTQVACIAGSFFTSWFTREAICVESPSKPRIVVLLLSCVWLFATPWIAACQAPCLSPSPGVCSESCSLSGWCYPIISSSVTPFSSCPQSFPNYRSIYKNQLWKKLVFAK